MSFYSRARVGRDLSGLISEIDRLAKGSGFDIRRQKEVGALFRAYCEKTWAWKKL